MARASLIHRLGRTASGWPRLVAALENSLSGLRSAWVNEEAFRQECLLLVVLIPAALMLGQSGLERAVLVGVLVNVLVVELINTAIEVTVDRVGLERHELSRLAKDLGSAAVFVSLLLALLVWLFILLG